MDASGRGSMDQRLLFIHEISVLLTESINTSLCIHQLLLAGEEGVGKGSNVTTDDVVRHSVNVTGLTTGSCGS